MSDRELVHAVFGGKVETRADEERRLAAESHALQLKRARAAYIAAVSVIYLAHQAKRRGATFRHPEELADARAALRKLRRSLNLDYKAIMAAEFRRHRRRLDEGLTPRRN